MTLTFNWIGLKCPLGSPVSLRCRPSPHLPLALSKAWLSHRRFSWEINVWVAFQSCKKKLKLSAKNNCLKIMYKKIIRVSCWWIPGKNAVFLAIWWIVVKVRQWTELRPTETLSTAEAGGAAEKCTRTRTQGHCEQWLSAANRGEARNRVTMARSH